MARNLRARHGIETLVNMIKRKSAPPTSPRTTASGATASGTVVGRIAIAIGLTFAAVTTASNAQDAGSAPQAQNSLNIPENITIFTHNDPNVRKAAVVINGEIITGTDVDQRVALILAANDNKVTEDELQRLRLQVLRNLMDETLQIQAAKVKDSEVSDEEVDQTFARVASQNFNQDPNAMNAYLVKIGSSPASLKRQIRGELSWQRVLRREVQPFVNVADEEVNELLVRLRAAKGTEEFRIGEIFLSSTPETEPAVFENGKRIVEQLRQGGSFVAYARQFSEASTAAVGGDLGWIRLAQLPAELATAARELSTGQLVGPIQIRGGFSIIYLIDKRQVLTADPRDAILSLKQVSISFPPGISPADAQKKASDFAAAMQTARGCGNVDAVAAGIGAQVVGNDGIKARDLPGPLQDSLLKLSLGETSPPFGSIEEGVRVLMLCGRDDPKADNGPSFEELMSQLEDDRVNKRAQMLLRDLRRDAIIDYN